MNMYDVFLTITLKSVIAGEYSSTRTRAEDTADLRNDAARQGVPQRVSA